MKFEECKKHESNLRETYIKSHPLKRHGIIKERLENLDGLPNELIVMVSAVEAMARSIILDLATDDGISREEKYDEVKFKRANKLLEEICSHRKVSKTPDEVFGASEIENFKCAEKYRDLLVHECTYLRQGISIVLIDSTKKVLSRLLAFYLE